MKGAATGTFDSTGAFHGGNTSGNMSSVPGANTCAASSGTNSGGNVMGDGKGFGDGIVSSPGAGSEGGTGSGGGTGSIGGGGSESGTSAGSGGGGGNGGNGKGDGDKAGRETDDEDEETETETDETDDEEGKEGGARRVVRRRTKAKKRIKAKSDGVRNETRSDVVPRNAEGRTRNDSGPPIHHRNDAVRHEGGIRHDVGVRNNPGLATRGAKNAGPRNATRAAIVSGPEGGGGYRNNRRGGRNDHERRPLNENEGELFILFC